MKKSWFHIIIRASVYEFDDHVVGFFSDEEIGQQDDFNILALDSQATVTVFELLPDGEKRRREDIEKKLDQISDLDESP